MSDNIPDGLWEKDGNLYFQCLSCGKETVFEGEPEDFEFGHWSNVCGGSPWCLP